MMSGTGDLLEHHGYKKEKIQTHKASVKVRSDVVSARPKDRSKRATKTNDTKSINNCDAHLLLRVFDGRDTAQRNRH